MKKIVDFFSPNHSWRHLIAIFLIFITIKGTIWIFTIAVFTPSDETTHFFYTHYIVTEKTIPRFDNNASEKFNKNSYEIKKVHSDLEIENTALSMSHRNFNQSIDEEKKILSNEEFINNLIIHPTWSFNYPPLYYLLESMPYAVGKIMQFDVTSIVYLMRIFSFLFFLITVIFSYRIALLIDGDKKFAFVVAAIISLMPSVSMAFASINNDAAIIAFGHIAFYYLLKTIYTAKIPFATATKGILALTAALAAKPQSIIFIPLLVGAYFFTIRMNKKTLKRNIGMLCAGLILVGIFIYFFTFSIIESYFNNFIITFSQMTFADFKIAFIYDIFRRIVLFFDFWLKVHTFSNFFPQFVSVLLGILIILAVFGAILSFYAQIKKKKYNKGLLFCLISFIALDTLYTLIHYYESIAHNVYDQLSFGRYYFLFLCPIIILFVWGIRHISMLIKIPHKIIYIGLFLFFAFLSGYSLLNIAAQFTYL